MLKQNTTVTNKDINNLFVYFLAFFYIKDSRGKGCQYSYMGRGSVMKILN